MANTIKNKGLAALCLRVGVQIEDVAAYCRVHRGSIHLYLLGRTSPRLEAGMADLFKISVPALRMKLGLTDVPATRRNPRNDRARAPKRKKGHPRD